MTLELQVIAGYMVNDPVNVWALVEKAFPGLIDGSEVVDFIGESIRFDEIGMAMAKQKPPHFGIIGSTADMSFSNVGKGTHSLLAVSGDRVTVERVAAAMPLLWAMRGFLQAWVNDVDYAYWQNATDPLQYKAKGKSTEGLPMRSNGLPPPLEQKEIDISGNPGRRVIRNGYVEAVAAHMWCHDHLWRMTGGDKERVLAADWITAKEVDYGIVYIKAQDKPFDSAEGYSGQLQNKLRELIFPCDSFRPLKN